MAREDDYKGRPDATEYSPSDGGGANPTVAKRRPGNVTILSLSLVALVIATVTAGLLSGVGARIPVVGSWFPVDETLCGEGTRDLPEAIEGYEHQARAGDAAITSVAVGYLPAGLPAGIAIVTAYDGAHQESWSYGYSWVRSIADDGEPSVTVTVTCGELAESLETLYTRPGREWWMQNEAPYPSVRGRPAMVSGEQFGGKTVGWLERPGTVIQVTASAEFVGDLDAIVSSIEVG